MTSNPSIARKWKGRNGFMNKNIDMIGNQDIGDIGTHVFPFFFSILHNHSVVVHFTSLSESSFIICHIWWLSIYSHILYIFYIFTLCDDHSVHEHHPTHHHYGWSSSKWSSIHTIFLSDHPPHHHQYKSSSYVIIWPCSCRRPWWPCTGRCRPSPSWTWPDCPPPPACRLGLVVKKYIAAVYFSVVWMHIINAEVQL